MENEKLQLNFAEGQQVAEVVIREVSRVNELDVKPPVKVDISGTIGAPLEFLSRRFGHSEHGYAIENPSKADVMMSHFDPTRCHVLINREKVTILLVIDEHDEYKRGTVLGTLELHPKFKEFGINQPKVWHPNDLGQFMKMNRAFFPDKGKNMSLVSELKNFEARVDSIIQKQKEDKGSFADNYSGVVTSNLPDLFTVELPVFKGYAKEMIEVEFYATVSGREVMLQLVSPAATELFETLRDKCIDEQIEKIREIAPNMVIIEQ